MNIRIQFSKTPFYLASFILATVPLLFGAVHPIVSASYVFLVLVGLGSWLYFFVSYHDNAPLISKIWVFPLLLLLFFTAAQSIPLPLSVIEFLSPARALRVEMVNSLAGTQQKFVSVSDHGLLSLTQVVLLLAVLIYYYSLRKLMSQDISIFRVIVLIVIILGVFEALYGLFQFLSPQIGVLWLPMKYRAATGTIIYKNQYASLLNMCWPLALAWVTITFKKNQSNTKKKKSRIKTLRERIRRMDDEEKMAPLFFLATAIMLLAVVFSMSRGGIITMLLMMIVLNFFLPIPRKTQIYFAGLFLFFSFSYGSLLGWDTLIGRFDTIGAGGLSRLNLYSSSLTMLKEHWVTGTGLGGYSLLSPIYLKNFASTAHFDKAHNEYLQLAIELGIPMAFLFVSWLSVVMIVAWRKLRKMIRKSGDEVNAELIMGGAAFCGLLGFLFHGIADFGWRLPANVFYAATLAALLNHSMANFRTGKRK